MSNIRLNRDHHGKLHMAVDGRYAIGAEVSSIVMHKDKLTAVVFVPLDQAVLGEMDNVIPLVRPPA